MLASYLMKICCRLWFLVGKHVPLMPHMKPKAAKEIAASEGNWFFCGEDEHYRDGFILRGAAVLFP